MLSYDDNTDFATRHCTTEILLAFTITVIVSAANNDTITVTILSKSHLKLFSL